ncbi:hypothetical protein [Aerosticca soli]|nr:hypothetical protein [Aerosticca soli]MDI3263171.1 hypothetical protein [Fulvimonas sp.]
MSLTIEQWTMLGTWAAPSVAAMGFLLIRNQLRGERESLETQTSWQVYEVGSTILQIFIANPECRPYFYDDKPIPDEEPLRSKVLAIVELVCDLMENVILNRHALDAETYKVWVLYMQGLFNRSPTMRAFLAFENEGYRYSRQLLDLLQAGVNEAVGSVAWLAEQRLLQQRVVRKRGFMVFKAPKRAVQPSGA